VILMVSMSKWGPEGKILQPYNKRQLDELEPQHAPRPRRAAQI
jgi:hypothetical protein